MKTFSDLQHKPHPVDTGGTCARQFFENGYGVSVVRFAYSYGGDKGLYELAVLDEAGDLDYSTPITEDVLGHLTEQDVTEIMAQVAALPAKATLP